MLNYIPILTTLFSAFFFIKIFNHYRYGTKKTYVLWWMIGVLTFGLGTLTESLNALVGWSVLNTKIWYIVGALLGGFPLAQGTIYLLMRKRIADILTVIFVTLIVVASICVLLTPVKIPPGFDGQLTGKVFEWEWVRLFSPFINIYSFIFLVGGAFYSAFKYIRNKRAKARSLGNICIAIGALLPGIGGTFTRMGYVHVLFVTEFIGLLLIYLGYITIRNDKSPSVHENQVPVVG
jgi:hypothetical protein